MSVILVGIGGGAGAIARYLLGRAITARVGEAFPWGTLTINVLGSLLIGVVFATIADRADIAPHLRLLLMTGVLGGFTTYSAFSLETVLLLESGRWGSALAYALGTATLCLAACSAGLALGRMVG